MSDVLISVIVPLYNSVPYIKKCVEHLCKQTIGNKLELVFVDDGSRYMKQSTMDERTKNYNILVQLLKDFGWWDKVEIINGNFLENFETVKNYISKKIEYGK